MTAQHDMTRPAVVVAPVGDLDLHGHAALREMLLEPCGTEPLVIVDLARVTFMDSSAIGLLVAGAKRCQRRGAELRIVNASGQLARIMRLTGLHMLVPIQEV